MATFHYRCICGFHLCILWDPQVYQFIFHVNFISIQLYGSLVFAVGVWFYFFLYFYLAGLGEQLRHWCCLPLHLSKGFWGGWDGWDIVVSLSSQMWQGRVGNRGMVWVEFWIDWNLQICHISQIFSGFLGFSMLTSLKSLDLLNYTMKSLDFINMLTCGSYTLFWGLLFTFLLIFHKTGLIELKVGVFIHNITFEVG